MSLSTTQGPDIALSRNPATGKFDLSWGTDGNPTFTDDVSHAVLSVLIERRGGYWADPSGKRGSFLYSVKNDRQVTPSQLRAYAEDALSYLVVQKKIVLDPANAVQVTKRGPGRYELVVNYSKPGGSPTSVRAVLGY